MTQLRIALMVLSLFTATIVSAAEFPLKQGDIWVMAGDSITAQHLHSNYFEAFCFARYPQIKFAFRNSGVGGHTITSTLARYDYDIDAWKPTVVSVELGMNDQGGNTPEQYISNMAKMVTRIRTGNALPVMLTASPINNGNTMANLAGNRRLHEYAETLKEFSQKEKLPFADQFHLLIDVWGTNKPRENLANAIPNLQNIAQNNDVAGVEHLRAFLLEQSKSAVKPVSMQGDPVHPGAPGQLMMAAALLKELGANPFVSSVTIEGAMATSKGCLVENLKAENGVLSFERIDESLPFPIPEEAAAVLSLFPALTELSQYTLQVKSLKPGMYSLKINGVQLPSLLSAQNLAEGVNLTGLAYAPRTANIPASAIVLQAKNVLNAVATKEGLVGQWRSLSQRAHAAGAAPELKDQLAEMTKKVMEADDKIREAAKPQKLHFELAPQQ
ncbi:MAG: GDSL-type esterase/lipase family protein [Planctomycetota bacterium]